MFRVLQPFFRLECRQYAPTYQCSVCNASTIILSRAAIERNSGTASAGICLDTILLIVHKKAWDSDGSSRFRRQPSDREACISVNCDRVQCLVIENQVCQPLEMQIQICLTKYQRTEVVHAFLTRWNASTDHCYNVFESLFLPVFN